jgi:hypothetical protein
MYKKTICGITIFLVGVFTLFITSCQLIEETCTVTFDSRGGSLIEPQTIKKGDRAIKPANPTSGYGSFINWYSNYSRTDLFDFDKPISSNITLYAKWNAKYKLGDAGPGSGIIFYESDEGFIVEMIDPDDNYTAYYLEAAFTDGDFEKIRWCNCNRYEGCDNGGVIGTEKKIGAGRKNTALIIASHTDDDATNNAAIASVATFYGKNDWFLTSINELLELVKQKDLYGISLSKNSEYWSSTEYKDDKFYNYACFSYSSLASDSNTMKSISNFVRAIRAF